MHSYQFYFLFYDKKSNILIKKKYLVLIFNVFSNETKRLKEWRRKDLIPLFGEPSFGSISIIIIGLTICSPKVNNFKSWSTILYFWTLNNEKYKWKQITFNLWDFWFLILVKLFYSIIYLW